MTIETGSNADVGQEQLSLERARALLVGAGRYFDRLLPYLREAVRSGQGDDLASLVEGFDDHYGRKRRKEIGKVEKAKGVKILGGGMLRFLPEAIGDSKDEIDRELLRLARRQKLTGELTEELVEMAKGLLERIIGAPPEGSIVGDIIESEEGRGVILDLKEAGVRLPDDDEEAAEEIAIILFSCLLRIDDRLESKREQILEGGGMVEEFNEQPRVKAVSVLISRLREEVGEKAMGRILVPGQSMFPEDPWVYFIQEQERT